MDVGWVEQDSWGGTQVGGATGEDEEHVPEELFRPGCPFSPGLGS